MSEVWVLEQLRSVRDIARSNAMYRLAEHLDDAMLLAASEFHDANGAMESGAYHDVKGATAVRVDARIGLH